MTSWRPPWRSACGPRALALHYTLLGILVEQGILLHDQEAVVVLLQDVMNWEEVKARRTSCSMMFRFKRLELRALMKRILKCCNSWWLLRAPAIIFTEAMRTLKVLGNFPDLFLSHGEGFIKAHFRHDPVQESFQLGNPCLILASVSVACECSFWILGKLRSPSNW